MKILMENWKGFLEEALETNAEQKKYIIDWGKRNSFEIEEKKPNLLVVKVEPDISSGKKKDARADVLKKLQKDLLPLGFVYDSTRGGSYGRFVMSGVKGKFNQLVVLIKSTSPVGRGSGAQLGMEAENKLASYISEKYGSMGITAKTSGAGHGSDLTILARGKKPLTIEIKTTLGSDFGQFRIGYDTQTKKWRAMQTKGFLKNQKIFQNIFNTVVGPFMNNKAQFTPDMLKMPSINIKNNVIATLKPLEGTGDFKKLLQKSWFGSTDERIPFDFNKISHYYASKGDQFIQIGKKGLYALSPDGASELGVPYFGTTGLNGIVRVRVKPHGGYNGTHSFTIAIKITGKMKNSPLNLTNEADLDKVIARYFDQ